MEQADGIRKMKPADSICEMEPADCYRKMELTDEIREMNLGDIIKELERQSTPAINDKGQNKFCYYFTRFINHFGRGRIQVGGSTQEGTRLRSSVDDGHCDYLLISDIYIPSECIEYKLDRPSCFVHINGDFMQELCPEIHLVEGKYLPSNLLSEIKPEAFKHWGDLTKLLLKNNNAISIDQKIKPGFSTTTFKGLKCSDPSIKLHDSSKTLWQNLLTSLRKGIRENPSASTERINLFLEKYLALLQILDNTNKDILTNDSGQIPPIPDPNNETISLDEENMTSTTVSPANAIDSHRQPIGVNEVKIYYDRKKEDDFVPMFQITGKPNGIDDWVKRERKSHWPPKTTLNKISNCEFFLVAMPTPVNPQKSKDFCLAYTTAETELSKSLNTVQKRVLLMIKALNKSTLQRYSKTVTSFHWKTALYWTSESIEQSMIEHDNEENALKLLHQVLDYMNKCLTTQNLQHYFIESNLFDGMDPEEASSIILRILEIKKNPEKELRVYLNMDGYGQEQCETITRRKLQEFLIDFNDHQLTLDIFKSVFDELFEEKEKFREAFRDVLTIVLDDYLESKAKKRNTIGTSLLLWALKFKIVKEKLINETVSYFLDFVGIDEEKGNLIIRKFLSLSIQHHMEKEEK